MRKVLSLYLLLFAFALNVVSQDIHFSQFYASPLTLNPALTGKFDGLWRVNAIYRGQWFMPKDIQPYSTVAGSVDFSLFKEKMRGNALGVGILVINDQQNFRSVSDPGNYYYGKTNTINNTKIALGLGYTLALGKKKSTQLSIGFEPQIEFRKLNFNYTFNDGFNPDLTYDPAKAGESLTTPSQTAFNFSAGLFFNTKPIDWLTFYTGYSMFNIARPKDQVLNSGTVSRRDFRHAVSGGFEFEIKKKFLIIPGAYFQYMAKATEVAVGTTLGYKIVDTETKSATFFLGCWGRVGRDVIPKIGFEVNRFRLGLACDVRLSQLQKDTKAAISKSSQPLAFEISLTYIGGAKKLAENNFLFNPRY